jgi:hypothetical protein
MVSEAQLVSYDAVAPGVRCHESLREQDMLRLLMVCRSQKWATLSWSGVLVNVGRLCMPCSVFGFTYRIMPVM